MHKIVIMILAFDSFVGSNILHLKHWFLQTLLNWLDSQCEQTCLQLNCLAVSEIAYGMIFICSSSEVTFYPNGEKDFRLRPLKDLRDSLNTTGVATIYGEEIPGCNTHNEVAVTTTEKPTTSRSTQAPAVSHVAYGILALL